MQNVHRTSASERTPTDRGRRGAVTVWMILAVPAVVTMMCVVAEVANLWLARTELTHSLEAAALGAVKQWGDAGGGSTLVPRQVGNAYSMANTINGTPVDLTLIDPLLNYDPNHPCNENLCGSGVLVFGAIVADNPEFVFDCCAVPGCGLGTAWLDVTGNSALGGPPGQNPNVSQENHWGISFQPNFLPIPPNTTLRIRRVLYTLPDVCQLGNQTVMPRWDFSAHPPKVSSSATDDDPGVILSDNCPGGQGGQSAQSDVHGIDGSQVNFYIEVTNPCQIGNGILVTGTTTPLQSRTLAIEFPDGPNPEDGLDLMDRIRFGARVRDDGTGQLDADAIGACEVLVTICFNDGTSCTASFVDTDEPSNQCRQCVNVAPWGINVRPPPNSQTNRGLIVHPLGIPDIPCPAGSGNNNNGQSLLSFNAGQCSGGGIGGAGQAFAVRAHATFEVPSLCCELFCIPIGPFTVSACADALYDCSTRTPRLFHLEDRNFLCGITCP